MPVGDGLALNSPEQGQVGLYYWDGAAWQKWLGNPLTIGAQLYYWDGAAWAKWQGNPSSMISQGYVWDGAAWQKMSGDASGHVQVDILSQPSPTTVQQTTPANLTPGIYAWQGASWQKVLAWASGALAHRRTLPSCSVVASSGNKTYVSAPCILYWATFGNNSVSKQIIWVYDGGEAGVPRWCSVLSPGANIHCVFDPPIYFSTNLYFLGEIGPYAYVSLGYDLG